MQAKLGWGASWCGLAGVALLGACAPSPKTVANVTTGITGCPSESLVVFGYTKATRTWAATCGERVYLCSDGRGPARCTEQQHDTVDAEKVVRAKAIAQLSAPQRAWFVDRDISQGDWASFAQLVATVKAMNEEQIKSTNPALVYAAGSEQLAQAVLACSSKYPISFSVDKQGNVTVPSPKPCAVDVVNHPELDPLRARRGTKVVLVPGIYGVKPVARPVLDITAPPAPAPARVSGASAPALAAPAPTSVSPELDAAVRQWLDQGAAGVVACTGKSPTALVVDVGGAAAHVSIRGLPAGAPEEGCVKSTLGAPPAFPAGAGQVLHVVKSP